MWVRSQDKIALINATTFRLYYSGYKTEWRIYCDQKCIAEEYTSLGTYSTKEKALKVLDWLEIHLLDLEKYKNTINYLTSYVFQMPQDSEVKI